MSAIEFPMSTALPSSRAVLLFRSRRYDKYKLARFLPESLLNCCSIHYALSEIYILLRKSYGMMNPYPRYRYESMRNIVRVVPNEIFPPKILHDAQLSKLAMVL